MATLGRIGVAAAGDKLPPRPEDVKYASIRELYLEYEGIFLGGSKSLIRSPCGHRIYCFEHHFFHMSGILVEGVPELSMKNEKATILATNMGFAHYVLREGGSRARHLRAARETLVSPDEVWQENPHATTAACVYVKEYDSKPYPFSIALVGQSSTRSEILVPYSSFAVERRAIKKWRKSKRVFPPETPTATQEG